jgi:MSHA biogenesis protein MshP
MIHRDHRQNSNGSNRTRRYASGFSLLNTLFLLVVVAGLGGYLVSLASTQHLTSALAVQQSRAYYAALAGLEWVAYQIQQDSGSPPACPASPTTFTVDGFDITARCQRSLHSVGGNPQYAMFDVTAEAVRGNFGDWDFVRRTISATISE